MRGVFCFRLLQGVYWLLLGTWFGAIVMLIVSAGLMFKAMRIYDPSISIEPFNQFPDRAAEILAGATVGHVLVGLAVIQAVCAIGVICCTTLQCTMFTDRIVGGVIGWRNLLRLVLLIGPILLLIIDVWILTPRIWHHREAMYDINTVESTRFVARERFDRLHKLDEKVVVGGAAMLLAVIFVSSFTLHSDSNLDSGALLETAVVNR